MVIKPNEIRIADWILHIKLAAVLVLLACSCNHAPNMADGGMSGRGPISSSDPFASFTPDLFTSIEKNDTFNEVIFSGIINNLNVEKRFCEDLQDTLRFVNSGIEGVNPFLSISRRIVLPETARKLELSLVYDFRPVESHRTLQLELQFFDKNSQIKSIIKALPATALIGGTESSKNDDLYSTTRYRCKIPKGANNLHIALYTFDRDSIPSVTAPLGTADGSRILNHAMVSLSLNKIGIAINNKPLEAYIFDHQSPFSTQEIDTIAKHISPKLLVDPKVKILAIGESIHGSQTFNDQASLIVKELISKGFNRIGMEISILHGIQTNHYIQGRTQHPGEFWQTPDSVLNFLDNPATRELIEYLRAYNLAHNNTLSIFGFDILNFKEKGDLIRAVANPGEESGEACYDAYFRDFYNRFFSYYAVRYSYELLFRNRDKVMGENIHFLATRFGEEDKVVLLGHLAHLDKRQALTPSAGHLLSDRLGSHYQVLGLFAQQGTFLSRQFHGFAKKPVISACPLASPIGKSLEQLCAQMDSSSFYITNLKEIPSLDKIQFIRHIGNRTMVMQFKPVDLRKEVDMIWFTKESGAIMR